MKTRKPLAYISLLLGVSFVPVKEEMIERGRYVVVNEFVERYYIVRTLEGKQVSYIHFESNEKIEYDGDNAKSKHIIFMPEDFNLLDINARERTDMVNVSWKKP